MKLFCGVRHFSWFENNIKIMANYFVIFINQKIKCYLNIIYFLVFSCEFILFFYSKQEVTELN